MIAIRKIKSAGSEFGDRAAYFHIAAEYGIFIEGELGAIIRRIDCGGYMEPAHWVIETGRNSFRSIRIYDASFLPRCKEDPGRYRPRGFRSLKRFVLDNPEKFAGRIAAALVDGATRTLSGGC
jgi:hypothetical protein